MLSNRKKQSTLFQKAEHSVSLLIIFLQVCQLSIGAVCKLSWPLDRMIVQVLDDSTDPHSKVLSLNPFESSLIFVFSLSYCNVIKCLIENRNWLD